LKPSNPIHARRFVSVTSLIQLSGYFDHYCDVLPQRVLRGIITRKSQLESKVFTRCSFREQATVLFRVAVVDEGISIKGSTPTNHVMKLNCHCVPFCRKYSHHTLAESSRWGRMEITAQPSSVISGHWHASGKHLPSSVLEFNTFNSWL
jgi:hypothetical protein